jgi:hypothetical protein
MIEKTSNTSKQTPFHFDMSSSEEVAMTLPNGPRLIRVASLWIVAGMIALLGSSRVAVAQNYRFGVSEMDLQVYVQPDASARLQYRIVFRNQKGAHPIDIVDIGLPHKNYSISNMSASIDGAALNTIRKSEYIDVGVEVHLGGRQIRGGSEGTFRFEATMPDMVYQDTTDKSRASLQMVPTWFDPNLQVGKTHLKIAVHLPPGVTPDEVTYQDEQTRYHQQVLFGEGDQKHVVVGWDWPQHALSSANPKIGVSFPKRTMDRVVTISAVGLLVKWFTEHPEIQVWSGAALSILFLVIFFRFSHGTGFVLGLLLLGGLVFMMLSSPGLHLLAWLPMIGLFAWNERTLSRRKASYLPAIAEVEGGGIKRGLTAPQAAVLLELPLGKVLTLVIFGLLKKGLVTMTSADPLTVEVAETYRAPRSARMKEASKAGIVVHKYEHPFLDRLMANKGTPVQQIELQEPVKSLVVATAGRMKGFDFSDSVDYYQRIVQRAWREAESIGEIEARTETVDRNFDWMMMDPNWGDRFDHWGSSGYNYHPRWSQSHSGGGAGTSTSAPATPATAKTSFAEVASSFTGWAESTSDGLASAIEPGSLGISTPRGIVDLSGVDRVTADVFKALGEASQSGGGGGGGGCACAGCACACACAGGGR